MAACGGQEHNLENTLPKSSTFLRSLSPLHVKDGHFNHQHDPLELDSLSIFTPSSPSSSSSYTSSLDLHPPLDKNDEHRGATARHDKYYSPTKGQRGHRDSFSSMSSESLSMCTEGLGFESSDDMEEVIASGREERSSTKLQADNNELSRRSYPPPISCIGRNGKPLVCFKSYRENGRFILKEIRIPNQEMLHSYRENGRFMLQFILPDDEILEGDEENGEGQEIDNYGKEGERVIRET